ncbi:unnamed protein product, partial [Eruca vesicaria subsp. sativa]|nr:unnamed protein product [Eruca vesicaria subsp. sativa]
VLFQRFLIPQISDHNSDAFHRFDVDIYMIELHENRRKPNRSEEDDICPICWEKFGT